MKNAGIIVMLLGIVVICGCSKPSGKFDLAPRRVTIRTEPAAAKVTQLPPLGQASLELGTTPLIDRPVVVMTNVKYKNMPFNETQQLLEHTNNLVILITKKGYEPYRATIATNPSGTTEQVFKLTPIAK